MKSTPLAGSRARTNDGAPRTGRQTRQYAARQEVHEECHPKTELRARGLPEPESRLQHVTCEQDTGDHRQHAQCNHAGEQHLPNGLGGRTAPARAQQAAEQPARGQGEQEHSSARRLQRWVLRRVLPQRDHCNRSLIGRSASM